MRICALDSAAQRDARLYRQEEDGPKRLRLNTYRLAEIIPLSDAVPVFENFGFRVLEEHPTALDEGRLGYVHEFLLEVRAGEAAQVLDRAGLVERAIADVLEGRAENDPFNQLLVAAALTPRDIVLFRAWFRYLRQGGLSYSMVTVVEALRRAPGVAHGLIALFDAMHDPAREGPRETAVEAAERAIRDGLSQVAAIDEDRILRLLHGVVAATLRTNAFAAAGREALAFKLDSEKVPNLPQPLPWREIWVYSPRVEGIHLRGGPIARGGLRWSDRRDDFRTEILGLMKAQLVKNAVIVPTGAKGGFYAKQLPPGLGPRRLARRGHGELPDLHPSAAVGDRQHRRQQDRPPRRDRRPRRRRPLFRRRRRQGHGELLRRRQRDRHRARLLARRRLRLGRKLRLRPQGDGDHRPRRVDLGPAPLPRDRNRRAVRADPGRRGRRHVGRRLRQRPAAVEDRSSSSPPSTTATSSSIPTPTRRRAGRSAAGCSTSSDRAGTITTGR